MVRSFKSSQINLIAKYIKNYYKGAIYIDQSGPFIFESAKISYHNIDCVNNRQLISKINKLIRSMTPVQAAMYD